jgi:ElaB/YqjD/DUF883 family membrane-anchored ribosome-binding protein
MYEDNVLQDSLTAFQDQLANLQSTFQQQLKDQQERFAEAQRKQEEKIRLMQQQALESQVRQASQQETAQVLAPRSPMVIRPGGSSRFSRPKLQIKSLNI